MLAKRFGNCGRYLSVLNWLSENGLSSEYGAADCGGLGDPQRGHELGDCLRT